MSKWGSFTQCFYFRVTVTASNLRLLEISSKQFEAFWRNKVSLKYRNAIWSLRLFLPSTWTITLVSQWISPFSSPIATTHPVQCSWTDLHEGLFNLTMLMLIASSDAQIELNLLSLHLKTINNLSKFVSFYMGLCPAELVWTSFFRNAYLILFWSCAFGHTISYYHIHISIPPHLLNVIHSISPPWKLPVPSTGSSELYKCQNYPSTIVQHCHYLHV